MSNNKLVIFLNNVKEPPTSDKIHTPVVLSDSKANWLKHHAKGTHPVEKEIIWWSKSGAKIKDRLNWLKSVIVQNISDLGPIWIFVWLGTCDLTTYNKKYISITTHNDDTINYIAEYYQNIVNLVQHYENCKITILETPVYSIYNWNKHRRHKTPEEFKNQDSLLAEQVVKLNFKVKEINDNINSHSPKFSIDLQIRTKYKKGNYRTGTVKAQYNLYADGIHPNDLLTKPWLRKITGQIQLNCWN
jgi:hypothetical protein